MNQGGRFGKINIDVFIVIKKYYEIKTTLQLIIKDNK